MSNKAKYLIILGLLLLAGALYQGYKYWQAQKSEKEATSIKEVSEVISVVMPASAIKTNPELLDLKVSQVDLILKEGELLHLAKEAQVFFKTKDDSKALRRLFIFVQTDCPTFKRRCETKTKSCLIEKETSFAKSLDQEEAYCVTDFSNCQDRSPIQSEISEFAEELTREAKKDYNKAYAKLITFFLANKNNRARCEKEGLNSKECEVLRESDCQGETKQKTEINTFICVAEARKCINESF